MPRIPPHPLVLLLLALTAAACEDAFIDPYSNDGKYFTVFGYLDQTNNFTAGTFHQVRVVPITRTPQIIRTRNAPNAAIDAEVWSINQRTGQTVKWTYALEELADGTFGHIYRTQFFVEPSDVYRLEVRRSDGEIAWAETKVPDLSSVVPVPDMPQVPDADGPVLQNLAIPRVFSLWDIDIIYRIGARTSELPCFMASPQPVAYGRVGTSNDEGWSFTMNISRDLDTLDVTVGTGLPRLCAMGIRARVMDGQWTPPGDVFDPEVLALPTSLSNVENGYGFFGSIGLLQYDWVVDDDLNVLLGF